MSEWVEKFIRNCRLKSSVIINGNINDIVKSHFDNTYKNIEQYLLEILKNDLRYINIIKWDRVNGIDNIISNYVDTSTDNEKQDDDYDIDDNEEQAYGCGVGKLKEIDEFFTYILQKIQAREKICFLIDYSDYIFSSNTNLSDQEKQWLSIIKKSIKDNSSYDLLSNDLVQQNCLIIFMANKLSTIPSSFYLNNPDVSTINIPMPTRIQKAEFVKEHKALIFLEPSLDAKNMDDFIDSLDSFTLKDITQIIKLSKILKPQISGERIINLYKYGESKSPWEDLSSDKLANIVEILQKRVKGQDDAINKVKEVIIRAFTGFSGIGHSLNNKKPKGVLFFVGPTGVGKTELAKALAEFLFGDENACIRFDMSEFNHEHSDQRLVGAPPGYVGYEEGGQLTNAIKEKPFSVILFDEIEKAHGKILDKFLQILEDGRLTDGKGETMSFAESVIIFTSNIGASEIKNNTDEKAVFGDFINSVREHFIKELKRPELLNRIGDNIVPFNFINSNEFLIQIAKSKFEKIKQFTKEKYKILDIDFDDKEKCYNALVEKIDKNNGGRGVLNMLESNVINPLSDFVFNNYCNLEGRVVKIKLLNYQFAYFEFVLE